MFGSPEPLNMPMMFNLITDPKELYPLDKTDLAEAWFDQTVSARLVEHKKTLIAEPPIRLGTPDPYVPPKN
jgi:arylsulfatase